MATILNRNLYELSAGRYKRLARALNPNTDIINKELERLGRFKELQDKNLVLGGMHRISYRFHIHDEEPLVILFNEIKTSIQVIPGINLHYLTSREAEVTIKMLMLFNSPRIGRGEPPIILWDLVKKLPLDYIPYRLYQTKGIRPLEYIPVDDWRLTAKFERSKWQGFRDF